MKSAILLALITMLAVMQNNTPQTKYYPAPPIIVTEEKNFTTNGAQVIHFAGLSVLQIVETAATNLTNSTTMFKFSLFEQNSSAYNQTYPGIWKLVKSSPKTGACSLIYEPILKKFSILKFSNKTLNLFLTLQEQLVRNFLKDANKNASLEALKGLLKLSDSCEMIYLDGSFIKINEGSSIPMLIPQAQGWVEQAVSPSLLYAISSNTIYAFNSTSNSFSSVYVFPASHSAYLIADNGGRLIVTGSNFTQNGTLFSLNQTVHILTNNQTIFTLLSSIPINAFSNSTIIEPTLSPMFTKIFLTYTPSNTTNSNDTNQGHLFVTIDYKNKSVSNIEVDTSNRTKDILAMPHLPHFYEIGDYFSVFRDSNCSMSNQSMQVSCSQTGYQFVKQKMVLLRSRVLPSSQIQYFDTIMIDDKFPKTLKVLIHLKINSNYKTLTVNYHNYDSMMVRLEKAEFEYNLKPLNIFSYTYGKIEGQFQFHVREYNMLTNKTTVSFLWLNDQYSEGNNVMHATIEQTGYLFVVDANQNCAILTSINLVNQNIQGLYLATKNSNNTYDVKMILPVNNLILLQLKVTTSTTAKLSFSCDKMLVSNKFVVGISKNTFSILRQFSSPSLRTIDITTMNYAFLSDNTLVKFDPADIKYKLALNLSKPLYATQANSASYYDKTTNSTRIGMYSRQASNTTIKSRVVSFLDSNGTISQVNTFQQEYYMASLPFEVNQQLDKVMLAGYVLNGLELKIKIDAHNCNYVTKNCTNISFPYQSIRLLQPPVVIISENNLMYIRHTYNLIDLTNAIYKPPYKDFVYQIGSDGSTKLILSNFLSPESKFVWATVKAYQSQSYLYIATLEQSDTVFTIRKYPVVIPKDNSNDGTYVDGNITKSCKQGCVACTGQDSCFICKIGYVFNLNTRSCQKCPFNCAECNSQNPNQCIRCDNRSYLNASKSCLQCNASCLNCQNTSSNCTSCPFGQVLNATGSCSSCSIANCVSCQNETICATCRSGLVPNANRTACISCPISCSKCDPLNITKCLGCNRGQFLINNTCQNCPSKCLECNYIKVCLVCVTGYSLSEQGVCKLSCDYPCKTCAENNTKQCTSCIGSQMVGNQCKLDTKCNATGNCSNCGQGFNLYKVDGQCLPCPNISNCTQCDAQQPSLCTICAQGFYLTAAGQCSACGTNCSRCKSLTACTECLEGNTLPLDADSGVCMACQLPCTTCSGTSKHCLSCTKGFTKIGWKCQNNTYIQFKLVFNQGQETILPKLDAIIDKVLEVAKQKATNRDAVTIFSILNGSTIITGSVNPSSPNTTVADVSQGLKSVTQIANLTVTSSTVVLMTQNGAQSESTSSTNNAGLIAGVVIGSITFILLIILVVYCYTKRKNSGESVQLAPGETQIKNNKY